MQKKLIAAALAGLLAAPAFAQSNVTISGIFRGSFDRHTLTGTGNDTMTRVSDQSSAIVFRTTEDLGGGLQAFGQLDVRFLVDGGAAGGGISSAGNTQMGLQSKSWGRFALGLSDLHYHELEGGTRTASRAGPLQSFIGHGIMSQVRGLAIANTTRTPNVMMWDSPNWNGFTARLAYSSSYVTASTEGVSNAAPGNPGDGDAWTGALRYGNGPWLAGLSYWNADTESGVAGAAHTAQRSTRLWGSYLFPMGLSIGLGWDRSTLDVAANGVAGAVGAGKTARSAWMIPVTYAWGPHKVYATYARAGSASGSHIAAGTGGNYKAHSWRIGYDYAFSKRTNAGVFYTTVNNSTLGTYNMFATPQAAGAGNDSRQWALGLTHAF